MRLAALLGPDLEALTGDPEALAEIFKDFHPEDLAELLEDLEPSVLGKVLEALPPEQAADLLERLEPDQQQLVIKSFDTDVAVELLSEMDPDDRADFIGELEESDRKTYLDELAKTDAEAAEETHALLGHGPETAGGLMTTEFVSLDPDAKVWEAIEAVRRAAHLGDAETIYSLYVVGYGGKLLGVVSLRDLILSEPGEALADIMVENFVAVRPTDDQEHVADIIARYDLSAVPVVDDRYGMLGLVTVDDVVDVVIDEATEDAHMMGGVVPLADSYFSTGLLEFVWKRGAWLIVLFLGQLLTATVMEKNQGALLATMELAIFIPLIISSGGNAGSQSSTLIIRAMAVGDAEPKDWLRVVGRELGIGIALGVILGTMGFVRAFIGGGDVEPIHLGLSVGVSIVVIVTLATVVGSVLPMIIQRAGLDPGVSSTPFIASVVDVLGLLVYFSVAQLVLTHVG